MTGRRRPLLYALTLITLGICLLLLTDWLPVLRGPVWQGGEWNWPYVLRPLERWWLPIVAAILMLGVSAWWLRAESSVTGLSLAGLMALVATSLFLQGSLIYAERPMVSAELVDRNLAVQTSGYYRTAAEIDDMSATLGDYPGAMTQFDSEHARTHPPGLVLGNWLLIHSLERLPAISTRLADAVRPLRCMDLWVLESPDAVLAGLAVSTFLAPLAAALAIPLAYASARQLAAQKTSRLATVLTATVPALLLFAPLSDQLLTFLSLLGLFLFCLAWRRGSGVLYFACGVAFSLASYASLGTMALLTVPLVILALQLLLGVDDRKDVLRWGVALLLGTATIWVCSWIVWGVAPWEIARTAMNQHYELVTSRRDYGMWLGFNLVDLLLFTGTAVIFGFVGALAAAFGEAKSRQMSSAGTLSLGVAALLAILLFSGTTRGEVGRIWLFMMPLLAISAGFFLAKWLLTWKAAVLIVGLQLALTVSLGLAWRPVEAVIVRAERPAMEQMPAEHAMVDIAFEQGIRLTGYSLPGEPISNGAQLPLVLLWQGDGPARRPYTVFVHLLDGAGDLISQSDGWPVHGQWPATCWQAGEEVVDPVTLALPADAVPGEYALLVGLYDASNGQRVLLADGRDAYPLKTIQITGDE